MKLQKKLFKDSSYSQGYGGELLKTRKGRLHGRPLDTRSSMHLVLRSSLAIKEWSFKKPLNEAKISKIVSKFAFINGITIISMANVGNHLHFQIKLSNRFGYKPFIRAITSAIAMAVTGRSRWNKGARGIRKSEHGALGKGHILEIENAKKKTKFWDYRPFTRVVKGYKALLHLKDYIQINVLEGFGTSKIEARFIWAQRDRLIRSG